MKKALMILLIAGLSACGSGGEQKTATTDGQAGHGDHAGHTDSTAAATREAKPKSPKQMAMANVGDNHIHIEYSAPSMRGRQIFGGLVAYDEVWVTGAHKATNISFKQDVLINGTSIPAGKYGFFSIPGQDKWTLILNKDWDMHLADKYTQDNDLLRLEVYPQTLDTPVEMLSFSVTEKDSQTGTISFSWDTIAVSFEVKND